MKVDEEKEARTLYTQNRSQERLGETKEEKTYKYMTKEKFMEKDVYRLLKLYKAFDVLIATFESVGEFDNWDKDQEVEEIYNELLNLQMDIYSMLRVIGIIPIGEEYED